jgi:hypothetical protein
MHGEKTEGKLECVGARLGSTSLVRVTRVMDCDWTVRNFCSKQFNSSLKRFQTDSLFMTFIGLFTAN